MVVIERSKAQKEVVRLQAVASTSFSDLLGLLTNGVQRYRAGCLPRLLSHTHKPQEDGGEDHITQPLLPTSYNKGEVTAPPQVSSSSSCYFRW